jgi:hypothetical protein
MVIAYATFGLRCRDYVALDPVMDHPQADPISLTDLGNSKGSAGCPYRKSRRADVTRRIG